jgi:hypothetical protein
MKIVKYLRKNSDELIAVSKLQAEGQRFPSWRRQKASSWQEIDPVQSSCHNFGLGFYNGHISTSVHFGVGFLVGICVISGVGLESDNLYHLQQLQRQGI